MFHLTTTASVLATILLLSSTARADIKVCNKFHEPLQVAFANDEGSGYTAAGWWMVAANSC